MRKKVAKVTVEQIIQQFSCYQDKSVNQLGNFIHFQN